MQVGRIRLNTDSCDIRLQEAAISYGVGAIGSFLYLRMLNRSVDSLGGGLGGALGQPRLLIPVVLALGFNRYFT